jgi:predicted phosphoribosyltransferase
VKILFVDRTDAAKQLAEKLLWLRDAVQELRKYYYNDNPLVILAIPRGGVVIGDVISARLGTKLDLVVSRKIGAPFNPELAIGAVMPDGTCFLNAGSTAIYCCPNRGADERDRPKASIV